MAPPGAIGLLGAHQLICAHDVSQTRRVERIELSNQDALTLLMNIERVEDRMNA